LHVYLVHYLTSIV